MYNRLYFNIFLPFGVVIILIFNVRRKNMDSHVKRIFDIQSSILLNYTLMNLMKFFMNPLQTTTHLYDTISRVRELTRAELTETDQKVPQTMRYEVHAEKSNNKLIFLLRAENLKDVQIYNIVLTESLPSVRLLKNVAQIIVYKYRPLPTRVDHKFSSLAKKYDDYLKLYEFKKSWQNGYVSLPKYYQKDGHKETHDKADSAAYDAFILDVTKLEDTYKAFAKILIDIYKRKENKQYSTKDKTMVLTVTYSNTYKISISVDNRVEATFSNEIISLEEFYPASEYFVTHKELYRQITQCVKHSLSK